VTLYIFNRPSQLWVSSERQ